jgi:integrase
MRGCNVTRERKRIGLREVRALPPNSELWDAAVRGFGIRRQGGPDVSYVLLYRTPEGRPRRFTIGRHGSPWTPDMARAEALRLLGDAVTGADPAAVKQERRHAATVAELCDAYLRDAAAGRALIRGGRVKKARTLAGDRGMIEGHIKPLLGRLPVASVTLHDVERFMGDVADGKTAARRKTGKPGGVSRVRGGMGTASRTVGLLGAIFAYAVRKRMRADNPCRGVQRPADGRRERRASDAEYAALGEALRAAAQAHVPAHVIRNRTPAPLWPPAVAAVRFLALTGWRLGEALALRWSDVDMARRTATLPDTKTGKSMRPLSHATCDVLRGLPRIGDGALVFPATRGSGPMRGFRKLWLRIARLGGLPDDVTPHVLRHSFASLAADLGYSEPTIAALIGHKGQSITSRYVHSADALLLAAADAVAAETAARMGEAAPGGDVVPLRRVAGG